MTAKSTKGAKKKQINTAFAMNLVIGFLALLMVGYMLTAGILLGKKTVQLEDKLDVIEQKKIAAEITTQLEESEIEVKDKIENKIESTEEIQKNTICCHEHCFNIEIVDTPEERSRGLMFRESMEDKDAMLFIFETEQNYGFRMKNTLIPLDMIWLNADKEIVHIAHDVQPCGEENSALNTCPSYRTDIPALYVLEINAKLAKNLNINIADTCNFTTH